jgi:hypothetical protein
MKRKALYLTPIVLGSMLLGLWAYQSQTAVKEVEIPAGTKLRIRTNQALDTARNRTGDSFSAMLVEPVKMQDEVLLPEGTPFQGHISAAKSSGRLKGRGYLTVTLDSFELNGQTYKVATQSQSRATSSHKKRNWVTIGGGSGFGMLVGALAAGGKGALIGGGVGAAAGVAGAALTGKKDVRLPAEAVLAFSLKEPVRIQINGPTTT